MTDNPKQIEQLRQEVWEKAVGTPEIDYAAHYFVQISKNIKKVTGQRLHPDTIRNFFQDQHRPRLRTLDIYSTYVLGGDEEHPRTFQEFIQQRGNGNGEKLDAPAVASATPRRLPKRVFFLLTLLTLILLLAGYILFSNAPRDGSVDHSIAVLPFRMIGDESQQYYADGITETVINQLGSIGELLVISRTSVEQYRNTTKRASEIGKELSVGYILEGSVQALGDQLRITVQLVDAKNNRQRWSKTYDRPVKDIFAVQKEIAQLVSRSLRLEVLPDAIARMEVRPTDNMEAYDQYLRGQEKVVEARQLTGDESLKMYALAKAHYEQAIAADPQFAHPYVGMANTFFQLNSIKINQENVTLDSVLTYCNKALQLDPSLPDAYVERAYYFLLKDQLRRAKEDLLQALALNPNHIKACLDLSRVYVRENDYLKFFEIVNDILIREHSPESLKILYPWIANGYNKFGNFEKALEYGDRWIELTRDSPEAYQARSWKIWLCKIMGRLDEALAIAEALYEPNDMHGLSDIGSIYLMMDNYPKAIEYFEKARALAKESGSDNGEFEGVLGQALYLNGDKEEAMPFLNKDLSNLLILNEKFYPGIFNYDLAGWYAFIGERENALKYLRAEKRWFNGLPYYIDQDVRFDNLRDDPEFQEVIRQVRAEKRQIREMVDSVGRARGWVL